MSGVRTPARTRHLLSCKRSTHSMGPTKPPIQFIPEFFKWIKRPGCDCDHTLVSTTDVKNGVIPPCPLYLHHAYWTTLRLNFIVSVIIGVNVVIVFTTARQLSLPRATLIQSSNLYHIPLKIRLIILTFYSKISQMIRLFLVL